MLEKIQNLGIDSESWKWFKMLEQIQNLGIDSKFWKWFKMLEMVLKFESGFRM